MADKLLDDETITREVLNVWFINVGHTATPPSIYITPRNTGRNVRYDDELFLDVNGKRAQFQVADLLLSLDQFSCRFIQPLVRLFLHLREAVDHPQHYGGADNPFEVIKVLEAWLTPDEFRGFLKGNAIKYNARARLKGAGSQDHVKAAWYQDYLVKWEKKVEEQKASKA